jgi:hypothetical protein
MTGRQRGSEHRPRNTHVKRKEHEMKLMTATTALLILLIAAPHVRAEHEVIGSIEAMVDGERKTWHVLAGETDALHSATMVVHPGGRAITLGGYESLDITFDTSTQMPTASGPGSMLVLTFAAPSGQTASYAVGGEAMLHVMLFGKVGDFSSARTLANGSLEISSADLSSADDGRLQGSFSGTFERNEESGPVVLTEGRFQVRGLRTMRRD